MIKITIKILKITIKILINAFIFIPLQRFISFLPTAACTAASESSSHSAAEAAKASSKTAAAIRTAAVTPGTAKASPEKRQKEPASASTAPKHKNYKEKEQN
jgi:hypothetical protein